MKSTWTCFNSKLVRLEGNLKLHAWQYGSFNSKLVRLEVKSGLKSKLLVNSFNSKLVRLEDTNDYHINTLINGFNSKLVRLEGTFEEYVQGGTSKVSIPNWFD